MSRDEIRKLQDKLVAAAERRGYQDDVRVSRDLPENMTLAALRQYIFPQYAIELRNILASLEKSR